MATRRNTWHLNVPATAVAGACAALVLAACYRSAVRWFTLKELVGRSKSSAIELDFPWWAVIAGVTVLAASLVVWKAGYGSLIRTAIEGLGRFAARKAREFGVKAEYQRRIGAMKRDGGVHAARAGRYARIAVYLKDLARRLGVVEEVPLPKSEGSDKGPGAAARRDAAKNMDFSSRFDSIPPRIVDIPTPRGTIPPRIHPMREGSWALSHSIELTGA